MSTPHSAPASETESPYRAWCRFWFAPADPTTLGFMRIIVGLLILYIHAVYSMDLQSFFGKDGWYGLADVNKERTESPVLLSPIVGKQAWYEVVPEATVPIYPHRREAVMKFIRALDADPVVRKQQLAFVIRLQNLAIIPDGQPSSSEQLLSPLEQSEYRLDKMGQTSAALQYLSQLYSSEKDRGVQLDVMVNKSLRSSKDLVVPPSFVDDLPETGPNSRTTVRGEIESLFRVLPNDPTQRRYVLDHFHEMRFFYRHAYLQFLLDLPSDAAERAKTVDYLEYWNNERRKAYRVGNFTFSLWFHVTDKTEMAVAHGCVLTIMTMFTLGLYTRVTSVLTWFAAISYIHRTQQVLFGMDTMMNILLIYLMVGNCGATLSLDRLLAKYRAAKRSLMKSGTIDEPTRQFLASPPPSVSAGFALRLTQIHFCIIYMAAGMSKLKGPAWWNTNAFWDTLANPEFTLIHFEWYEHALRWAMQERLVYATVAGGGVIFTLFMELMLPVLVWTRLRPYIVMGAVLLHVGIAIFMGLNIFGLLMLALLLSYIPSAAISSQLFGSNTPSSKLTIRLNATREADTRAAAMALAVDTENQVEVASTREAFTVAVDQKTATGRDAANLLFSTLSALKSLSWLKWIPGISRRMCAM